MTTLALLGGKAIRRKPFPAHVTIGTEEQAAADRVLRSGILSNYLGCWHDHFYGGQEVQALEKEWAAYVGAKNALAVNSATSGLICAVGALDLEPGDEIIVTPWSMCISATAPLWFGAIPVFADIEPDCFCLDSAAVEAKITPRTKAILVVDIFGQPYDAPGINALARKHGITVIEDCTQAPGALLHGKPTGTLGDMGIFSLNYHKHIHCGEGGVIVTNDDALAERLQLIRNHAEAVVEGKGVQNLVNMVGQNYRMTELEAAVARCQLPKLAHLNARRRENVRYLEEGLRAHDFLHMPVVREGAQHVYYAHACLYSPEIAGVSAHIFAEALRAELPHFDLRAAEGTKVGIGYVRPLYMLPLFQQRIAFGSQHWPFSLAPHISYPAGLCPCCERLHAGEVLTHEFMLPSMEKQDLDDVLDAFAKVAAHKNALRKKTK